MKPKFSKFFSGLIPFSEQIESSGSIKGNNFIIDYEKPHPWRKSSSDYELVIYAKNLKIAFDVNNYIMASTGLLYAGDSLTSEGHGPIIIPEEKSPDYNLDLQTGPISMMHGEIPLSAKIAAKCSYRNNLKYALLKYQLACNIYPNELDNIEYRPLGYITQLEKVKMAYAIVIYYSIIEELGLEIRANINKPSFIKKKWNPEVKSDLESRLVKSGIDIDELIDWNLRSTPTKIEKNKRFTPINKSPWAHNSIRDSQINLIDAIGTLSWIRSKVVAHRFTDEIKSLSSYDVSNASFLTRRLLLEKLGYWKKVE